MPSDEQLTKYADVAIRVGMNVEPGDRVLIGSYVDAADFTRLLVERAYEAGAANVDVLWSDDAVGRARFSHGSEEAAHSISTHSEFFKRAIEVGDHYLRVMAPDPDALAGQDPARVGESQRRNAEFLEPTMRPLAEMERPWTVVAAPTPAWAATVFPDLAPGEAVESLWTAILRACRADQPDPIAAWEAHLDEINRRATVLNDHRFTGLRYEAPGTDLRLGLSDGTIWMAGRTTSQSGRPFLPNIPTEEVFTSPHRLHAEGTVTATKPLSLFGNLVEGFSFRLEDGAIVEAHADRGQDILDQMLATDPGSRYFGEAAMVPGSSAVAAEALVWNNTLYDENDGCHIAVGRAYPTCLEGGTAMSPDEQLEAGLNQSSVHVDFVLGSDQLSVFGVSADGAETPILSGGEWAFEV